MEIKLLASVLLLGRLISVFFIWLVLRRQWQLLKLPIDAELRHFRSVLFMLSTAIFVGNLIPILIDVLTISAEFPRNNPSAIGVLYAFSNNLTAVVSSILIWLLYKLAARDNN